MPVVIVVVDVIEGISMDKKLWQIYSSNTSARFLYTSINNGYYSKWHAWKKRINTISAWIDVIKSLSTLSNRTRLFV